VREVSDPLTSLVKTIDKQLEEAAGLSPAPRKRGIYIIFCNDDPNQTKQLQAWIADEKLKHVVICKESAVGPDRYRVAKDADVTAVVYSGNRVKANIALRDCELDEDSAAEITKALSQVLPKKAEAAR
jgi:hypothetical protein